METGATCLSPFTLYKAFLPLRAVRACTGSMAYWGFAGYIGAFTVVRVYRLGMACVGLKRVGKGMTAIYGLPTSPLHPLSGTC